MSETGREFKNFRTLVENCKFLEEGYEHHEDQLYWRSLFTVAPKAKSRNNIFHKLGNRAGTIAT